MSKKKKDEPQGKTLIEVFELSKELVVTPEPQKADCTSCSHVRVCAYYKTTQKLAEQSAKALSNMPGSDSDEVIFAKMNRFFADKVLAHCTAFVRTGIQIYEKPGMSVVNTKAVKP